MLLSDVCLMSVCLTSVACIGPNSRTDRHRKTKIGTEVAHVTRDLDTTFNVRRSKVKDQAALITAALTREAGATVTVRTYFCPFFCLILSFCTSCTILIIIIIGRGKLLLRCGMLGGVRRFGARGGMRGAGAYLVATRTACYNNRFVLTISTDATYFWLIPLLP